MIHNNLGYDLFKFTHRIGFYCLNRSRLTNKLKNLLLITPILRSEPPIKIYFIYMLAKTNKNKRNVYELINITFKKMQFELHFNETLTL